MRTIVMALLASAAVACSSDDPTALPADNGPTDGTEVADAVVAGDTATDDSDLPDTPGPGTDASPDVPSDATEEDASVPDVSEPPDEGAPVCVEPIAVCGGASAGDCCESSWCVGNECPGAEGVTGRCTDPARDTCGCGAAWDDCDTAGTLCLAAGCDYPGICVTPQELAEICADPAAAGCFECPLCGDALCTEIPPPECASNTSVRTYSQQWLGCKDDGACDWAFEVTSCADGESCTDGTCLSAVPECGPVPTAFVGTWNWTNATAVVPGYGDVQAFDAPCAATGVDQNLNPITIGADGTFQGALVTDYLDTWTGCLAPSTGQSLAMVVESCEVTCYGNDATPGKLGVLSLIEGKLVIRRTGPIIVDKDGVDCAACSTCGGPDLDYVSGSQIEFFYEKAPTP